MAEDTNGSQPKSKTKAKTRYLKRKKERRKLNKKAKPATPRSLPKDSEESDSDSGESEENEDIEIDKDEGIQEALPISTTENQSSTKSARPKKRRKISAEPEDVEMEAIEDIEKPPESPVLEAPLPSFPLPALPDAPSKSILALQGLDKGLLDANIITPSTVLPLSADSDGVTNLSEKMRRRLNELGITELFAVQTSLLPFLLPQKPIHRALYQPYHPPRDVCVSAPTGSGKTLAYAIPIVEILSSRIVTRLRALIVLPTRDLVVQVRETFEALNKGRGLKIGTATGQHSFSHEQSQLVADQSSNLLGGSSKVDILICTPGRLIDHLNETTNFSLQHLRFLVIDEADRLLAQSFQDWLAQVLAATRPPKQNIKHSLADIAQYDNVSDGNVYLPATHDALAPAFLHLLPYPDTPSFITENKESSCQKLLFSATLTRDPGKIAALDLRNPKYFVVQKDSSDGILDVVTEKFTMPATLKEHMIVCETTQKPLIFFHLVHSHNVTNALVFTKSAESTTRLVKLIEFFESSFSSDPQDRVIVRAYSSDLGAAERKSILESFKSQKIQILACSDLISRGIDISHVSHVVSYDAPVDIRKYVHRAGRTARAGREGDAWTLVEEQEARHFKNMMKASDHLDNVKRVRVNEQDLQHLIPHYDRALAQLKDVYSKT